MASSHTELINEIIYFCEKRYGTYLWKNNSGVKGRVKFGLKGSADILGLMPPNGRFVAIEVKVGKDVQSPEQLSFQAQIASLGGIYVLAYKLEDVIAAMDRI